MPNALTLSPDAPVTPVAVAPGGAVVLRGLWTVAARDLAIDGCQSGPSAGAATGAGAVDWSAGGWQLQARDWSAHSCRLVATGQPAAACSAAGVEAPCLPSRLAELAHGLAVPMSAAEFRAGITGGLGVEVLTPAATALVAEPEPPSWAARHAGALAGVALAMSALALGARGAVTRARRPEARVRRAATRVRARLASADPVYERLAPVVDALGRQAGELAALRDRLRRRVLRADRPALERRRVELGHGSAPESVQARALVDEQLAHLSRWDDEAGRAAARLDRVLEYLRALDARLDDALDRAPAARGADDAKLLAELERDVEAALAGAREADRLTG